MAPLMIFGAIFSIFCLPSLSNRQILACLFTSSKVCLINFGTVVSCLFMVVFTVSLLALAKLYLFRKPPLWYLHNFFSWLPRCPCTFSSGHVYFLTSSAKYTISVWSQPWGVCVAMKNLRMPSLWKNTMLNIMGWTRKITFTRGFLAGIEFSVQESASDVSILYYNLLFYVLLL